MPRQLALLFFWFGLSHCASIDTLKQDGQATLFAQPFGPSRRVLQKVEAHWHDQHQTFLFVLELDNAHVAVAGMNSQGVGLFNVWFDGKTVNLTKSPLFPANLPAEQILHDLQSAYWPLPELKKNLTSPWHWVSEYHSRKLYEGNNLVIEIIYLQPDPEWPKAVTLNNHLLHYQLAIKTISHEMLPE